MRRITGWFLFSEHLLDVCEDDDDKTNLCFVGWTWKVYHWTSFSSHNRTIYHSRVAVVHMSLFWLLKKRFASGCFNILGSLFTHEYRCNKQLCGCHGYKGFSKYHSLNPGDDPSGPSLKWWHLANRGERTIRQHFSTQRGKKLSLDHTMLETIYHDADITNTCSLHSSK